MCTDGNGADGRITSQRITLPELEALCDDPSRDLPGGVDVRAVLDLYPGDGFVLVALDGETHFQVTDGAGQPLRFRTIESALQLLQDVHHLSKDIGVFLRGPIGVPPIVAEPVGLWKGAATDTPRLPVEARGGGPFDSTNNKPGRLHAAAKVS
jgi:hypothetical protein